MQTNPVSFAPNDAVPYTALPNQPQGQGNSLLGVVLRRKGLLSFFLLIGLGGGYYYHTLQPETYASQALVEVYRQQTRTETGSAIESVQDVVPSIVFVEAEIKSDAVLRSAVEIGQLTSFEGMPKDADAVVRKLQGKEGLKILPPFEKGSEGKDRSLVQVRFDSSDPAVCAAVVDASVKAYEQYVNSRHTQSIDSVVSFFKEARGSILPQLTALEAEYTKFRGTAPLEWSASGEAINPFREDAIRLEENLHALEMESRQLGSKLRLIEEATKGQKSAVAILQEVQYLINDISDSDKMLQSMRENGTGVNSDIELKTKLMGLRVQAELLSKQFAPNHPQRQAIDNELALTEKALLEIQAVRDLNAPVSVDFEQQKEEAAKTLIRSYVSGIRKKQQLVNEDITNVSERLAEVREKAHKLIEFENENASYARRLARYQEMLDSFDGQLEKASLPLMNPGLKVNVFRPAGLGAKVGPELSKNLLMGAIIGLVLGGSLSWLVDWSERTYRNPDEIAETLGVPILTHMPLMLMKKKKGDDQGEFDSIDRVVSVVHDPHSAGSEAIRSVRTGLFATSDKKAEYQIIQVTSALPGDGKSTVVANLAASIAKANKRVIIVDADLRRPTQEILFGLQAELGLTSVLNGECDLASAIVPTAIEGLFVLPTGPRPSNPAEALMLPEFSQLLDDLRTEFDTVLVDTPPLLAVTDASNVANQVDGVMFVLRIGRNAKPMSKRAITMLRSLHVNIVGVVVNAIGDSGYSATYASAWSDSYGGQPGSEYGYGYYRYGSDRYLNASKGQSVTVKGRSSAGSSDGELVGAKKDDLVEP